MKSLSNLVKAGRIIAEDEKRVIDYNDLISVKLTNIQKEAVQNENPIEDSVVLFESGIAALELEDPSIIIKNANEEAKKVIEEAYKKAASIIEEAKIHAEINSREITERAKKEGFQEGLMKGTAETNAIKEQLAKEKEKQDMEYRRQIELLEPELVHVILEVFSKVFDVILEEKEDVIQHLIAKAVSQIENSYEFIIRVSKEDYERVMDGKDKIFEEIPRISTLEIVKDISLKKNQCLIETDGGVFDCSLDTQLERLLNDIKVLSSV